MHSFKKKSSKSWKDLEKKVPKILGGKRLSRGSDYSQSLPDVEHPIFSIECKYTSTKRLRYFRSLIKPGVFVEIGDFVVIFLEDFAKCLKEQGKKQQFNNLTFSKWIELPDGLQSCVKYCEKIPKWLTNGISQAEKYDKEKKKIPVLITKERYMRGELVFIKLNDFIKVLKGEIIK